LIHQPLISGVYKGVTTDVEIFATEMEKTRAKINKIISEETGVSLDQVQKDTERDYWLNAQEAVDYGLVGKIITRRSEITTD
jgi:ATP-dependent Clp protease protease subunit